MVVAEQGRTGPEDQPRSSLRRGRTVAQPNPGPPPVAENPAKTGDRTGTRGIDGEAAYQLNPMKADTATAEKAAAMLLESLGVDLSSGALADTPRRVVAAYQELLTPHTFEMTVFPNDEGYSDLVLARAIPFRSLCEHHLLPFYGTAHVGYIPGSSILGLSKLARVVEACSRGFQIQERMTARIGAWLEDHLSPLGVGVVVEGTHTCMTARGVRATGASTMTMTFHGALRDHSATRQQFLTMACGTAPGETR
jgi:GTP cyclohydrolase IA